MEIIILNRPRMVSARWDGDELLLATRSHVSGNDRLLEDRWKLVPGDLPLQIARVHHMTGGAVHQLLRFRKERL